MAAILHVYTDEACSTPLTSLAGQYAIAMGPQVGLDGDTGEIWNGVVYVKNEGDQKALFVRAYIGNDEFHYVAISIDGIHYQNIDYVEVPAGINNDHSMSIGDIQALYVRIQVPPGTEAATWNPRVVITFKTLP